MVTRLLALTMLAAMPAWALEVAGVRMDERARVGDTELHLRGAGVRKRIFFQVYAMGLYVQDRKADPVAQPGPKRVQIHMLRDVGAEQFSEALSEGIKANHGAAESKAIEPRVQALGAIIGEVKQASKGMVIALDWTGRQTQVVINGKPVGQPIAGEDFYRALLRIWLGEKPVQAELKDALLGPD